MVSVPSVVGSVCGHGRLLRGFQPFGSLSSHGVRDAALVWLTPRLLGGTGSER
ncbi:hypothetical protein [Streptomyces chartreusis]